MKRIVLLLLLLVSGITHAAIETIFEGLVWCADTPPATDQLPKNLQSYTPAIPILSYLLEGKKYYAPVGYSNNYKNNINFFVNVFNVIETRIGDIISTAPTATKSEKLVHIIIVSAAGGTFTGADANNMISGSKIIGDSFGITFGTTTISNCYLIAVKRDGLSEAALNEAINQMLTASIGEAF